MCEQRLTTRKAYNISSDLWLVMIILRSSQFIRLSCRINQTVVVTTGVSEGDGDGVTPSIRLSRPVLPVAEASSSFDDPPPASC